MQIKLISINPYHHGNAVSLKFKIKNIYETPLEASPEEVSIDGRTFIKGKLSSGSKTKSIKLGTYFKDFDTFRERFFIFFRHDMRIHNFVRSQDFSPEIKKIFDAYRAVIDSGVLERAKFMSKKKMWSRRVEKLLVEALQAGVSKDEVSDLIDVILTKQVLES
jgi:hypothetical protein